MIKKILKRTTLVVAIAVFVTGGGVVINYLGGHSMALFSGTRPTNLGFNDGKFRPPSTKPNWVSSTVPPNDSHYIAPIIFSTSAASAWKTLLDVVATQPRAGIIIQSNDYLYVESKSKLLGFIDDVEFALDTNAPNTKAIHVHSSSRLGESDLGVNRKRIEAIRTEVAARLGAGPAP